MVVTLRKKSVVVPIGKHKGRFVSTAIETGKDSLGQEQLLKLVVELEAKDPKGDPFKVDKTYNLRGRGPAVLEADFSSWKGRAPTADELERFDVEQLMNGQPVIVEIDRYRKEGTKHIPSVKTFHPVTEAAASPIST